MFAAVATHKSSFNPILSSTTKMMNALLVERDWLAQEVMHHLLGLPLVESSRIVVPINVRSPEQQNLLLEIQNGSFQKRGKSWLEKYFDRMSCIPGKGVNLDQITFFDFVQHCDIQKGRLIRRPQARPRILRLYPLYSAIPDEDGYEDYCRVKLMLHHPFQDYKDIQGNFSSYRAALLDCDNRGFYHPQDPLDPLDEESDEDESEDESDEENEISQPDFQDPWIALAARNPPNNADHFLEYDLNLGTRTQDRAYNWQEFSNIYNEYGDQKDFFDCAKLLNAQSSQKLNNPDTLQAAQRVCFDMVMASYERELADHYSDQLLLHVDGAAGTGKSYLLDMISTHLKEKAFQHHIADPALRAPPTGVAAFNIHGETLHRLLRLPVGSKFYELTEAMLFSLQSRWKMCRYLMIDEKSMLGLRQLHWLDSRLRQIFPSSTQPFGGIHILLLGDFCQLPLIGERALYDTRQCIRRVIDTIAGQQLYQLLIKQLYEQK